MYKSEVKEITEVKTKKTDGKEKKLTKKTKKIIKKTKKQSNYDYRKLSNIFSVPNKSEKFDLSKTTSSIGDLSKVSR